MPHIYSSLQGYPGKWVCLLEDGRNIMVRELLEHMDMFGNVHDYDSMIRSLYEIWQPRADQERERVHAEHPQGSGSDSLHTP